MVRANVGSATYDDRYGRAMVRVPAPVSGALGLAIGVAGRLTGGGRDVWARPGRLHIETHGVHGVDGARVARRVERVLERHPGVVWARVNAPACRVVVEVADPPPPRRELVALVARAEAAPASVDEEIAEDELHHPAEGLQRTGVLANLAVDAVALAVAGLTRVAPWAPLPAELAGLVSAVELHPRLRELAAGRLHGQERAESLVSMAAGLAQALAAGGSGVVVDVAERVGRWREARADQQAWRAAEPRLIRGPEDAGAGPVVVERPRPLPDGPVERYQRRVLAGGAAVAAVAAPLVGPRRAAAVGLAALPRATEAGRAAFASHLGLALARSGALVMDRAVLRRLDRLDTLVLDGAALRSGPSALTGLADAGADVVAGPGGRSRLAAVPAVEADTAPGLDAVVGAARRCGLRIVLATDEQQPRAGYADALVKRGGSMVGVVRDLQAAGGVVMLLSGDRQALAAADCGLGVHVDGSPPPWGAHVLIGAELGPAVLLVAAVAAARRVDEDCIVMARAATGIGALAALGGGVARPAARSLGVVNVGAALGFADGVWRAHRLHTDPGRGRCVGFDGSPAASSLIGSVRTPA